MRGEALKIDKRAKRCSHGKALTYLTHYAKSLHILAGKRRASAIGERRHAEDKKGYGGQKFPKLAKPAKVTKKVTRILTCPECKKKFNTYGIRIKKFELVAA